MKKATLRKFIRKNLAIERHFLLEIIQKPSGTYTTRNLTTVKKALVNFKANISGNCMGKSLVKEINSQSLVISTLRKFIIKNLDIEGKTSVRDRTTTLRNNTTRNLKKIILRLQEKSNPTDFHQEKFSHGKTSSARNNIATLRN